MRAGGEGLRLYHPQLDCRGWLDMPGGRRVWILGDVYSTYSGPALAPVGVFDRLSRGVWLRAGLEPPLRRDIALWSLVGLARAMGCDPQELRAELSAGGGRLAGARALSLAALQEWGPG